MRRIFLAAAGTIMEESMPLAKTLLFFCPLFLYSLAEAQTAKEIIKRADDLLRGKGNETSTAVTEMSITTPNWDRTMRMHTWAKGTEKSLIRIVSPLKEAGNTTLKIKNEMWNYLARTEITIKIPPSMMLQSWNGSDFTNDDLVRGSSMVNDYTHTLLGTEVLQDYEAYSIQLVPKLNAPVVWGKIITRIEQSNYVPLKTEYYNEKGELVRVMTYSELKNMHGRFIPTIWEMKQTKESRLAGRKTTLKILDIRFGVDLDEDIFSLRSLEKKR